MTVARKSSPKAAKAALGDAPAEGVDVVIVGEETHEIAPLAEGTVIEQEAPASLLDIAGLAEPKAKTETKAAAKVEPKAEPEVVAVAVSTEDKAADTVDQTEPDVLDIPDPEQALVQVKCLAGMFNYGDGCRMFKDDVRELSPDEAERGLRLGFIREV